MQGEEYVARLKVSMGNPMLVEELEGQQGLFENALGHRRRVTNCHAKLARFELGQLLDHGIDTRAHGLKHKTFMSAIGPVVLEFVQELRDMRVSLLWQLPGDVAQDG